MENITDNIIFLIYNSIIRDIMLNSLILYPLSSKV